MKNPKDAGGNASHPMAHSEVNDVRLVLVSARKSRGADHWDKDDYDVRLGDARGAVIGRITRRHLRHSRGFGR